MLKQAKDKGPGTFVLCGNCGQSVAHHLGLIRHPLDTSTVGKQIGT